MGMAASQARLLTITARMHDVEYAAQSIQNAKITLANQSDEVYQEYLEALDATTLTVKDFNGNPIAVNFNNLCGINSVDVGNYRYVLRDERGRIIVPDDIAEDYLDFKNFGDGANDPYAFAMYMLTGGNNYEGGEGSDYDAFMTARSDVSAAYLDQFEDKLLEKLKELYIEANGEDDWTKCYNDAIENAGSDSIAAIISEIETDGFLDTDLNLVKPDDGDYSKKAYELVQSYKDYKNSMEYKIFKGHSEEIFETAGLGEDYNDADFWYYVNIFKQLEAEGGNFVKISEFDGLEGVGDAATDGDWLQSMIKAGKITIDMASLDKNGNIEFKSTGVSSDSRLNYTTTSTIDKAALAKAEAEYEHKTKQIDKKDKQYDMELSKLETERNALKTEYDSVKKVIQDNIERTFGIFS